LCEPFLDGRKLFDVGGGGYSCVDVGDQMRNSLVATLRKVHLVANPAHRTLGRVASLHLVRRFDAPGTFRHLFWVQNPYLCPSFIS
jgi:hypothetical protein